MASTYIAFAILCTLLATSNFILVIVNGLNAMVSLDTLDCFECEFHYHVNGIDGDENCFTMADPTKIKIVKCGGPNPLCITNGRDGTRPKITTPVPPTLAPGAPTQPPTPTPDPNIPIVTLPPDISNGRKYISRYCANFEFHNRNPGCAINVAAGRDVHICSCKEHLCNNKTGDVFEKPTP